MAAHAARAGGGAAALPVLASDAAAAAPGLAAVPPPAGGASTDVPGWEAVRLLAPRAELRLLVAARASLADAARLGCAGRGDFRYSLIDLCALGS